MTITTKYLGPTNTKGARIKAKLEGTKLTATVPYPHEFSGEACHREAAKALFKSQVGANPWWLVGELDKGYVYVSTFHRFEDSIDLS